MEGLKKFVIVFAVLVVGALVISYGLRKAKGPPAETPKRYATIPMPKIDMETGEVITRELVEWQEIGMSEDGVRWKNPNTGKYTMRNPIECLTCGKPMKPPEWKQIYFTAPQLYMQEVAKLRCPNCGNDPNRRSSPERP